MPSTASPPEETRFWRRKHLRVFISHLAEYKSFATALKEALLPFGISCFVAHDDIEPTTEWQNEIESALKSCEALVALMHPRFHESKWTDQEIGFVMGREIPAFAVRLGETPYGFIGRFQAFNGNSKTAVALATELFDACRKHNATRERMGEALVDRFVNSGSFADAKELIGHLEELPQWKSSYAKKILAAAEQNSQVSGSWGVSSRVSRLAEKWQARA